MSSNYRKDRYLHRTAERKGKVYFFISLMCFSITLFVSALIIMNKQSEYQATLENKQRIITKFSDELAWLRTINPIKGDYLDLEDKVVKSSSLFPGWVTRVYPVPKSINESIYLNDVGTFILNESKFSLASHQNHGINQQQKSMYVLNALLPSRIEGRHQFGLKLTLNENTSAKTKVGMSKMASCYSQLFVNQKRVIDKKINLFGYNGAGDMHTGELNLVKGLYPISAKIYCDKDSEFFDRDMEVSILFRDPSQQNFQDSRYNVFHIYKPNTQLASL